MTGTTAALVEGVRGIRLEAIPDDARAVARHCLLDWLGVTLAGSREPLSAILSDELLGPGTNGEATVIGRRRISGRGDRAPAAVAALVNGAAAHALDFDDTHMAMMGHPTAPVAPAVVALAEARGASGADLLASFVTGVETECRVALVLGPGHYRAGWHATGTIGTFGAAAACAHLLGLDPDQWRHALGIAGTQAAGLKAVFGTMCKPLHAGRAAANGLLAARLAARGFTSATEILETDQGFGAVHTDTLAGPEALQPWAGRFLVRDTLFKHHAACYLTHAAIEAARRLRDEEGVKADDLSDVEVEVHPTCIGVCDIAEPRTGLEGKFSLRATTAMAFLGDDTGDPETFSDTRMADADLVALRDRVRVTPTGTGSSARATVRARLDGGREVAATADTSTPAADLEEQGRRLTAKFALLASPVVGPERAELLAGLVGRIETLASLEGVMDACRP